MRTPPWCDRGFSLLLIFGNYKVKVFFLYMSKYKTNLLVRFKVGESGLRTNGEKSHYFINQV